jgi:GT2 family glycosyltransferase
MRGLRAGVAAPPLITVAVCTRGRPDDLVRCLESLHALDDPSYEILVIDNAPTPEVDAAAVAAVGGRCVHEPRRGLDAARNRAALEARGDVVAFIDDDCEADPAWLAGVRRGFSDPSVACVTGRAVAASQRRRTERWFEDRFTFDRGLSRRRFVRQRRQRLPFWPGEVGSGCNMAFRRSVFARVGLFDESLDMGTPIGGGGDLDMFARILDAGEVIAYEPSAVIAHHHRRTVEALRKQFYGYGATQGALCMKWLLHRRGRRVRAARAWAGMVVKGHWRTAVHVRRVGDAFPASLYLVEGAGAFVGPLLYLWSAYIRRKRGARVMPPATA